MSKYNKVISEKRRPVDTPKSMVNEDGTPVFGTFKKEFKEMDLTKINKPTKAPNALNKYRLTLWEACEINLKEGIILAACCDMAIIGKIFILYYDKTSKKVYTWDTSLSSKKATIAGNLINSSMTHSSCKKGEIKFVNNLDNDQVYVCANHINSKGDSIYFEFNLSRLSDPSIVSIPFGKNRPLYSQKDFFKAVGKCTVNGTELTVDDSATAIVDDHKGYYPRRSHYDWITTMGKCEIDGQMQYLAFNLTENQSINPEDYNENILWLYGKSSLLPPIKFIKKEDSHKFKDYAEWIIKDEHDMVNIKYKIYGINPMILNLGVLKIDYFVNFGVIEGYVRDEDGKKYIVDNMIGIGEDKSLLW